jgi:hypothetical protein
MAEDADIVEQLELAILAMNPLYFRSYSAYETVRNELLEILYNMM